MTAAAKFAGTAALSRFLAVWLCLVTCAVDAAILRITNTTKQRAQAQVLNIAEVNIFYYDGSGVAVPLFGGKNSAGLYGATGITALTGTATTSPTGASTTATVYMAASQAISTATTLTATVTTSTTMTLANDKCDAIAPLTVAAAGARPPLTAPSTCPAPPAPAYQVRQRDRLQRVRARRQVLLGR